MKTEGPQQANTESSEEGMKWLESPRVWGTAAQNENDEKREELANKITERFGGPGVKIEFAEKGASSLVTRIETPEGKTILKVTLDERQGEAKFLEVWEKVGVTVPHVTESGFIDAPDRYPFIRMDYIDAITLDKTHTYDELVQEKKCVELGQILHVMHLPVGEGYGQVINGRGEFDTFADYVHKNKYRAKQVKYAEENQVFNSISIPRPLAAGSP